LLPFIDQAKIPTLAIVGAESARGAKYMMKFWLPARNEAKVVENFLLEKE